ncbi:RagB/SusD family nutrient uptake outer membrane protein [Labilibaculum euxinus]
MKRIIYILICMTMLSCSNELDMGPKALLGDDQVGGADNVDGFVTAAYSSLGNDHYDHPFSLWPFGNVRSDDAYKGGSGPADIQDFHFIETFSNVTPNFGELDALWYNYYIAISRANEALNQLALLSEEEYPEKKVREGEMRFLKGYQYFQLKIMFKYIPYIDETVPDSEYENISNVALSNDELWEKIAADFQFAIDNLPVSKTDIGRADKFAAQAMLAKTRLYQAYEQDDDNNVTNINTGKLEEVVSLANEVLNNSPYDLEADFAYNFLPGDYENGKESIFAVQYSTDDGTMHGRLNFGDVLAVPMGLGCCDFHKPSQNLVNAYKTSADGLPEFDTYNQSNLDFAANNVDPRIDHTIATPGHMWKYDQNLLYEESWNRSPDVYGVHASLKENVSPDCPCFVNIDPFYGNSKNRILVRYADVMLWKAEALIELGRQAEALELINRIRERAQASTELLKFANGSYMGNYLVGIYVDGVNCNWTQDFARKALRWERRLEFAMEGSRYFDLVRWGIAKETMDKYFMKEKERISYYEGSSVTKGRDEYLPIPQKQINFSKGLYQQNVGY